MDEGDEREALLGEVRHRMANAFQLIATLARLRAQRSDDPEARRQVEWVHDAVSALALLQQHRLGLSGDGEDFAVFLHDLAAHWRRRAAGRPVRVELITQPMPVGEPAAAALAVMAHELVSNALAHAFPGGRSGLVSIACGRLDDTHAFLSVSDDGVGYAPGASDPRRLGLWLVAGLADQIGGRLVTTSERGVVARFEFPIA